MRHLTLLTDLYELTMMQGWYFAGKANVRAVFDRFYRGNPYHGGYTVFAGLEHVIQYIQELVLMTKISSICVRWGSLKKNF